MARSPVSGMARRRKRAKTGLCKAISRRGAVVGWKGRVCLAAARTRDGCMLRRPGVTEAPGARNPVSDPGTDDDDVHKTLRGRLVRARHRGCEVRSDDGPHRGPVSWIGGPGFPDVVGNARVAGARRSRAP